jgi:hypothetical protein
MLVRHSFDLEVEAGTIEAAVSAVLDGATDARSGGAWAAVATTSRWACRGREKRAGGVDNLPVLCYDAPTFGMDSMMSERTQVLASAYALAPTECRAMAAVYAFYFGYFYFYACPPSGCPAPGRSCRR